MSNKKIVLLSLYDFDSMPVATLHSVLINSGYDAHTVFFKQKNPNNTMTPPTSQEIELLVEFIQKLDPLFIGISVRSTFFQLSSLLSKEIKKKINIPIVFGGIHPTIKPDQCLEYADIVCIGEGEQAIVALADRLSNSENFHDINNLWIKQKETIYKNPLKPLITDLDSIPFPNYSNENKYLVDANTIIYNPTIGKKVAYDIMTSRGCPFRCSYCCNNILKQKYKGMGKYLRRRSVDNVIEELLLAKVQFKTLKIFMFQDDVFTFDKNWLEDFCKKYKKKIELPFSCYGHTKFINDRLISLLQNTGLTGISLGLQTGSEQLRHKYYKRHETNSEIIKAAQIIHKHGVRCTYDLIIDNPLETETDNRETFDLLKRMPHPLFLVFASLTNFPEYKLTKKLLKKGLITENDVEDKLGKSYYRWSLSFDLSRNKQNMFWECMFFLLTTNIPVELVESLSRMKILKMFPRLLASPLRLISTNKYSVRRDSIFDRTRFKIVTYLSRQQLLIKTLRFIKIRIAKTVMFFLQFNFNRTKSK